MKSQEEVLKEIKNILVDLASNDNLPLDFNEFDINLLRPAFYNGKDRYFTFGERVYDRTEQKYLII